MKKYQIEVRAINETVLCFNLKTAVGYDEEP